MTLNQPIPANVHVAMLRDVFHFMQEHHNDFTDPKKSNDDLASIDRSLDELTLKYKDYYFTDSTDQVSNTFIWALLEPNLNAIVTNGTAVQKAQREKDALR